MISESYTNKINITTKANTRINIFTQFNTKTGFSSPICYEHLDKNCSCKSKMEVGRVNSMKKKYENIKKRAVHKFDTEEGNGGMFLYKLDPSVKKMAMIFEKIVINS